MNPTYSKNATETFGANIPHGKLKFHKKESKIKEI